MLQSNGFVRVSSECLKTKILDMRRILCGKLHVASILL